MCAIFFFEQIIFLWAQILRSDHTHFWAGWKLGPYNSFFPPSVCNCWLLERFRDSPLHEGIFPNNGTFELKLCQLPAKSWIVFIQSLIVSYLKHKHFFEKKISHTSWAAQESNSISGLVRDDSKASLNLITSIQNGLWKIGSWKDTSI